METQNPSQITEPFSIVADPNKRIPKYCTNVLFSRLSNGNMIITFLENDPLVQGKVAGLEGSVLIERILLDKELVTKVFEALKMNLEIKESDADKTSV